MSASRQPPAARARRGAAAGNLALALGCGVLAAGHAVAALHQDAVVVGTLLVVEDVALAVCFLIRRNVRAASGSAADIAAVALAFALPLLLDPGDATSTLAPLGRVLEVAAAIAALAATATLGASFGVLPADRGVAVRGPYAAVRHPLYAAYLVAWAGHALRAPSATNLAVVVAGVAVLAFRAVREERLLARRAAYRRYQAAVPWRLVPRVW